ncbi:putative Rab11 family-interacting protein 2 [Hypsibius exemplaris]|uniref:Rab11 family-interacting protein 2 n=1 Tax=Hypsibius exemplaris TaxID=2072580 RepID=A0A9X6NHP8_HYPEX|nr:putative Rab11 family-interacting protein 2 [Hypsibius exemplaris]
MSHWSPTHVQVTVIRAKNLIPKSKNGETNNAYITIQLGKEKFETSVLEKTKAPEWNEECELRVTDLTGSIVLSAYHKHTIGTDDFLGRVELPLTDLNFYDRPKNLWFPLRSKKKDSGKEEKYRGEIQVRLNFYVQNLAVSVPNLLENGGKKERSGSFRSTLSKTFGTTLPNRKHHGSVMDISSTKSSGFGSGLFSSLSRSQLKINEQSKVENGFTPPSKAHQMPASQLTPNLSTQRSNTSAKNSDDLSFTSSVDIREREPESPVAHLAPPIVAPPPVVSKSSSFSKTKSIVTSVVNTVSGGTLPRTQSQVDIKSYSNSNGNGNNDDTPKSNSKKVHEDTPKPVKAESARNKALSANSMVVETKRHSTLSDSDRSPRPPNGDFFGGMHASRFTEAEPATPEMIHVPKELMRKYGHLEKGDLIAKLADAEKRNADQQAEIDRMSTYIETLLLRVMDTAPKLLQTYPASNGVVASKR